MKRIGLLGGESSGKSTLAAGLERALSACVVPEELRAFVEEHGRPPSRDEQVAVLRAQWEAEESAAATCAQGVLVADPATLMTAVYSEVYFDDASLTPQGVALADAYDLVVWCADDVPWRADGAQRDGEGHRAAAEQVIARIVATDLVPRGVRVIRVTGSVEERVAAVLQAWQSVGDAGPT